LNFIVHLKEKNNELTVSRIKFMIWPLHNNADFIELEKIEQKNTAYPYIIHWAGIKFDRLNSYPRADILKFYLSFFNSKITFLERLKFKLLYNYLPFEKRFLFKLKKH
jgi:hypothetical protein